MADLAGGAWPEKARSAAITLSGHDQENDPVGTLFMDILLLFITAKADRLFSRDLLAGLKSFPGRPWTALRNGKEVTDMWLSHKLRPYGVSPKTLRIGGLRGRGYVKSDFADLFRRYIPASELEALRQHREANNLAEDPPNEG